MIVGGDGDYSYLSRRIRGNGKRVMVCAFGHSVNSELLAIANPFLAIESLLNVEASISPEIPLGGYNWEPLIKQLDTAEKTLPFVGFKHFRDKWLVPTIGSIETIEQRHRLLNDAQQEKLIEIYQQSNPGRNIRLPL